LTPADARLGEDFRETASSVCKAERHSCRRGCGTQVSPVAAERMVGMAHGLVLFRFESPH